MVTNKETKINKGIKILFIIASILFAMPSIVYWFQKKSVFQFGPYFQFLYDMPISRATQTLLYILLLAILVILYVMILRKRKEIFFNTKKMFLFISIIAILFVIVLPFTCSDIFYYLGIGRLDSRYHQNPYYTTIKDYVEQGDNQQYLQTDTVLAQGYENDWANATVVYGPIWTLICRIIAGLSFGNINIGLLVFKLVNVLVHLLNCYLIYKISHKRLFTCIYGLNPFILIEGIACVHNDIFVVMFVLLALYFLTKKKNLVATVSFLAMATAIKYFAIILLPFVIIYYFRKETPFKRFRKMYSVWNFVSNGFSNSLPILCKRFTSIKWIIHPTRKISKKFLYSHNRILQRAKFVSNYSKPYAIKKLYNYLLFYLCYLTK